jgi:hypothetical protein
MTPSPIAPAPLLALLLASLALASCGRKDAPPDPASVTPPNPSQRLEVQNAAPSTAAPSARVEAAGAAPPDGKYERVTVEGVTVPMINVMENGTVVLVDTDGQKPRTWEEQYKRKRELPAGSFDVHKTDANKDGKFDDDKIDREGLWSIDAKGNIQKR